MGIDGATGEEPLPECWWWTKRNRERVGDRPAHLIKSSHLTETPAGTDGVEYEAYCSRGYHPTGRVEGEVSIQNWNNWENNFGSVKEALDDSSKICTSCLRIRAEYGNRRYQEILKDKNKHMLEND